MKKKYLLGCVGLFLLLALIAVLFGAGSYNRLVGLEQDTNGRWADVENQYERRLALIPNLVETVKGAANFEKSTLTEITQARASVGQMKITQGEAPKTAEQLEKFEQAQGQLGTALSRLLVVAERYPDLKATGNFRELQAQLEGTENRITVARMDFNKSVQGYNTAVKRFPAVFWARMLGFEPKPFFKAQAGSEVAPAVKF